MLLACLMSGMIDVEKLEVESLKSEVSKGLSSDNYLKVAEKAKIHTK